MSVFCENIAQKIAGISLRVGLSYLCGGFNLGILELAAYSAWQKKPGTRHQDGLFSSDLPFFKNQLQEKIKTWCCF